ncbi:MAG: alkyl hydroperoxide reductase [Actinomycetota bacterium]|nr:MAG: alkyl hydroperoxide reductase [Actinomycetota bacterium]
MRHLARSGAVAAALALLVACGGGGAGELPRGLVEVDEPMPALAGPTLDGGRASAAALAGRPLVVNVWATWCGPCERELPALVTIANRYRGRVGFLGVNYVDDAAAARRWERDYRVPYPSIVDASGRTAHDLGFPYLPHTLIVDGAGTIRYRIFGETTAEQLQGVLERLLTEP